MKLDELEATETWGQRLAREAKALAERWPTAPPLAAALAPVIARVAELPDGARYHRREAVSIRPAAPAPPPVEPPPEEGAPLPSPLRDRLGDVVGPAARVMRVHTGAAADALAKEHRASAVTVGEEVFFRRGAYRPEEPRGFGLLAHEATHVAAALEPGAAALRATSAGVAAEESLALSREAAARDPGAGSIPMRLPAAAPPPAPQPVAATRAPQSARPMAAAEDRGVQAPSAPAPIDTEALRRGLMRDLLAQLRTELERGG